MTANGGVLWTDPETEPFDRVRSPVFQMMTNDAVLKKADHMMFVSLAFTVKTFIYL